MCSSLVCTTKRRIGESPSSLRATTSQPCRPLLSVMAVWRSSTGLLLVRIVLSSASVFSELIISHKKLLSNSSTPSLDNPSSLPDFFGALAARVYDDEVRQWISGVGVETIGKKLVNSREGPPKFEQPKMTLEKLLEYGFMLVQEQENVKRVQLADTYMKDAALGDANKDAIERGTFYGKAAQQVGVPVPEGCTDPGASNFDPTARSDNGSCLYTE